MNLMTSLFYVSIEIIKYSIINWHYTCSRCLVWGFEEIFGLRTNDILEFSCVNEDFLWQEIRDKICTIGSYSMNLLYRRFENWLLRYSQNSFRMQKEFFKISQRISTVKIRFNGNLQEGFDLLKVWPMLSSGIWF